MVINLKSQLFPDSKIKISEILFDRPWISINSLHALIIDMPKSKLTTLWRWILNQCYKYKYIFIMIKVNLSNKINRKYWIAFVFVYFFIIIFFFVKATSSATNFDEITKFYFWMQCSSSTFYLFSRAYDRAKTKTNNTWFTSPRKCIHLAVCCKEIHI